MLAQEIIRRKRDKQSLSRAEIEEFINGVTDHNVSEAQVAAFCMAVLLNGMDKGERTALTMAMAGSGTTLDWSGDNLDGPVLDKHSTGGVGDKVSLMLAPIVAACGAYVPMISGRGLGHTGGTLDKMDAIPGYNSQPDLKQIKKTVKDTGLAIIGATKDVAPADRIIYAVRDVTGTVESLDLITASILSKKLSAGLGALVMDVKYGSGAFMADYDKATALAQSIVEVAQGAGVACSALMTDMNQVLGRTAGNAIEVREAAEFLRGENIDPRLYEVTIALCGELLVLGGIAENIEEGQDLAEKNLGNGRAADFFGRSVAALGGPADLIEHFDKHLKLAPIRHEVHAAQPGIIQRVDTRALGLAVIELGGGRRLSADKINHSTGLAAIAAPGEEAGPSEKPLAVIFGAHDDQVARAEAMIRQAFEIGAPETDMRHDVPKDKVVRARIGA